MFPDTFDCVPECFDFCPNRPGSLPDGLDAFSDAFASLPEPLDNVEYVRERIEMRRVCAYCIRERVETVQRVIEHYEPPTETVSPFLENYRH